MANVLEDSLLAFPTAHVDLVQLDILILSSVPSKHQDKTHLTLPYTVPTGYGYSSHVPSSMFESQDVRPEGGQTEKHSALIQPGGGG